MSVNLKRRLLYLCFLVHFLCPAQEFGVRLGLVVNLGTHANAIGLKLNGYFCTDFVQLNIENQSKIHLTSWGKRQNFTENRFALGAVLMTGKDRIIRNFEFSPSWHNTQSPYSIGYTYYWYLDNIGTSQKSGAWSIGIKKFQLYFENDVFGGQAKDRFRSGLVRFAYLDSLFHYDLRCFIWTGETKGSVWNKKPMPGAPNGFRDLRDLPFGKTSHGILAFGITRVLPPYNDNYMSNYVSASIGVDSEQIRHFVQNKLSHDLIFMPKSYKRNTPHYPRLNKNGLPVFEKKERKKDRLFLQMGTSEFF